MERDRWHWTNLVDLDSTILTATSTEGDLGVYNLRDARRGKIWRASLTGPTLTAQFTNAWPIAAIGLLNTDMKPGDAVTVQIGTAPGLSDVYAGSHAVGNNPQGDWMWLADMHGGFTVNDWPMQGASGAWVSLTLAAGREAGRLWIAPVDWLPLIGQRYGTKIDYVDPGVLSRAQWSGAVLANQPPQRLRRATLRYEMIADDDPRTYAAPGGASRTLVEQQIAEQLGSEIGVTRQVLYTPNPAAFDPQWHTIMGYMNKAASFTAGRYRRWGARLSLQESG